MRGKSYKAIMTISMQICRRFNSTGNCDHIRETREWRKYAFVFNVWLCVYRAYESRRSISCGSRKTLWDAFVTEELCWWRCYYSWCGVSAHPSPPQRPIHHLALKEHEIKRGEFTMRCSLSFPSFLLFFLLIFCLF